MHAQFQSAPGHCRHIRGTCRTRIRFRGHFTFILLFSEILHSLILLSIFTHRVHRHWRNDDPPVHRATLYRLREGETDFASGSWPVANCWRHSPRQMLS